MGNAVLILCGLAAFAVVGIVVLAALCGWGEARSLGQRLGLCGLAAGLVAAGIDRALMRPVGWGDLLFLGALALYLAFTYVPAILRRADALDGVIDGRISLPIRRKG